MNEQKKKRGCLMPILIVILIPILLFVVGVIIINTINKDNINTEQNDQSKEETILIDVNQFARITPEELTNIMGEAENIEKWDYDTGKGIYPTTTYRYKNSEFLIIDNAVVRVNIHSDKYNDKDGASIKYSSEQDIFKMLNITPSSNLKKVADTVVATKYQLVSDKVAELWIPIMDKQNKTIDEIKITYNLNYFG